MSKSDDEFEKGQTGVRPDYVTDEHLEYLDELRASGACNMFAARPYVSERFPELERCESAGVLGYWMKTFGEKNR